MEQTNHSNMEQYEKEYVDSLSDKERVAHNIAKKHLGSSFSLRKSIGFKQFLVTKKKK